MRNNSILSQGRVYYVGDWVDGRRTGRGKMVYNTGEEYEGDWSNNLQVSHGCTMSSLLSQVDY